MVYFAPRLQKLALCLACAAAGGAITHLLGSSQASATSGGHSPYAFLGQLSRVLVLVENEYVEPVDRARLLEGSIQGMVAELDPHSAYLPAQAYALYRSDTEGRFGGVGVEVDFGVDRVTVIAPIEGSPAARQGILPGDRIVGINGKSIRGQQPEQLIQTMRGTPGTRVKLTVQRPRWARLLHFTLTREVIAVSSVKSKLLTGRIAYLRIKHFQDGTHTELLEHIAKLRHQAQGSLSGVLLDLRNNPGGMVDECTAVANEFLERGAIYSTRARGKASGEIRAQAGGALTREPLVALVNEYSASAAELVAGALQDHQRGTIVGAQTFGKGSVQSIIELPGGAGLRLTTMRYYTPNGGAIQAQGITPTVKVASGAQAAQGLEALRESDLDNHLPAEGPAGKPPAQQQPRPQPNSASNPTATHAGMARQVPADPTGGADLALSVGYQILKGVLKR